MAHVGGRSRFLSGQKIFLPLGTCCDTHPEVKAIARIVGEVDSFGYEAEDMCEECFRNINTEASFVEGTCDWCKSSDKNLKQKRDPEEGTAGRVYLVCMGCIVESNKRRDTEDAVDDFNNDDSDILPDDDYYVGDFDIDQNNKDD